MKGKVASLVLLVCTFIFLNCGLADGLKSTHVRPLEATEKTVLFLPLDERFVTRDSFLNLAKLTPFNVITPPTNLLPHMKKEAPIDELIQWVEE
jgi:hypothetical protein